MPNGVGVTINPNLEGGRRVSWTDSTGQGVLARFGAPPTEAEMRTTTGHFGPLVRWADTVLRGYVLPELRPEVLVYWITEPDETQHAHGVNSPQTRAALAEADAAVGRLVAALDSAGGRTNYFVLSDHGFTQHMEGLPVVRALVKLGLKRDSASTDVMVVNDAQTIHLYVAARDRAGIQALVTFFQSNPSTAAIFARDPAPLGTFPLSVVHLDQPDHGADLVVTFGWRPDTNAFGVTGTQFLATEGAGGPVTPAGHGGLSPYTVHATMILAGPAFQRGTTVATPSGNVDVTPTVLSLLGLPTTGTDGRVLREAFVDRPPAARLDVRTDTLTVQAGRYRSALQITTVGRETYVDRAWRLPERTGD